jgi:two-component system nitrogen regulation sensor histidine kinase NtrY
MSLDIGRHRKAVIITLLVLVPILFLLGWSQASLNLSFIRPSNPPQTILLLVLSTFIFLAFVIFALILTRLLLKAYVERRQQKLGARFKTKMLVAFLGLSLVPVCFLFAFAYGLLNRSIDKWFGVPVDLIRKDAQAMVEQLQSEADQRAVHMTRRLALNPAFVDAVQRSDREGIERHFQQEISAEPGLESVLALDAKGRLVARAGDTWPGPAEIARFDPRMREGALPQKGAFEHWRDGDFELHVAAHPLFDSSHERLGTVLGVTRLPLKLVRISDEIQHEAQKYDELSAQRKAVKRNYLSMLWLLTLLILFIAAWFAVFLSKQVTVPIQALAQGTQEVAKGDLGYQVSVRADDELGTLIQSFNAMTRQLQENRVAIELAARELQEANRQLEARGNTIEAILENIPTGVISFDPQGQITRVNSTAARMFGSRDVAAARVLADLFTPEDTREISRLFRRAARQGVVTRQMEVDLAGRRAFVALTVSSVRARHGTVGAVLVLEDLTEVLRVQKAAAWQEVAQRIAHEIKNPLTPIQLSADRLQRLIERAGPGASAQGLLPAVAESATLIGREVATLKTLVDEFSAFARFPASHPVSASLNQIIENALNMFDGRLSGVEIHRDLAAGLPIIQADPEQMKRVVANLIDNAAEALEHSFRKEIWVRSSLDAERDVVEVVVADSGPGIPREAKERLFLPYFSTKRRGTGLGLAIVSRIVAEHNGSIRVEENRPTGTKFVIELPVERAAVEPAAPRNVT